MNLLRTMQPSPAVMAVHNRLAKVLPRRKHLIESAGESDDLPNLKVFSPETLRYREGVIRLLSDGIARDRAYVARMTGGTETKAATELANLIRLGLVVNHGKPWHKGKYQLIRQGEK